MLIVSIVIQILGHFGCTKMSQITTHHIKGLASTLDQVTISAGHTLKVSGSVEMDHTGAFQLPTGTTAQRPGSPQAGYFRFNTTESKFEAWDDTNNESKELLVSCSYPFCSLKYFYLH